MLDDVLIHWRTRGDHDWEGGGVATPGPPGSLPCGSDGAGITRHHNGVERADVDTEFERVGRHDGANVSGTKALLDLAPLTRQIASAIPAHRFSRQATLV